MKNVILLLLFVLPSFHPTRAELVYSNSTTDTLNTLFASVNGASEIGDHITLDGTARLGQTATVQYFTLGDGMFDATLRFYEVGSPVGLQIGTNFTVPNIGVSNEEIGTIDFALGGLTLPDDIIFTFEITNVTPGLDVGLNLFEPPTIGNSTNDRIILGTGGVFAADILSTPSSLYFTLDATAVPEPSPWLMIVAGGLIAGLWRFGRRWVWGMT